MSPQKSYCDRDEEMKNEIFFQAAAQNVRVDGDIIRQQNEVLNWQAEGAGSMQVRSLHEGSLH